MVFHPEIQAKAQAEIDDAVGNLKQVSNSDISNLPYVQAIAEETLRVHPLGHFLSLARFAIYDVHTDNDFVPEKDNNNGEHVGNHT